MKTEKLPEVILWRGLTFANHGTFAGETTTYRTSDSDYLTLRHRKGGSWEAQYSNDNTNCTVYGTNPEELLDELVPHIQFAVDSMNFLLNAIKKASALSIPDELKWNRLVLTKITTKPDSALVIYATQQVDGLLVVLNTDTKRWMSTLGVGNVSFTKEAETYEESLASLVASVRIAKINMSSLVNSATT